MLTLLTPNTSFKMSDFDLQLNRETSVTTIRPLGFSTQQPLLQLALDGDSVVKKIQHADPARNFRWLLYIPGKVTCIPITNNTPIFTGFMSGCWLVLFTYQGVRYFGHIGTDTAPDSTKSTTAKSVFRTALTGQAPLPGARQPIIGANRLVIGAQRLGGHSSGLISNVTGFNPCHGGADSHRTLGALAANGDFHAVHLNSLQGSVYQVVQNRVVPATPELQLLNEMGLR